VDFLTKKKKVNEGEVPQFYVEQSHPGIVTPEVFDLVQDEIKRSTTETKYHSTAGCFASQIVCGECGGRYGRRVWHKNTSHSKLLWQCNSRYNTHCKTPHIYDDDLQQLFVEAVNRLITNRAVILRQLRETERMIFDVSALESDMEAIAAEERVVSGLLRALIEENAHTALNQVDYHKQFDALDTRHNAVKKRLSEVSGQIRDKTERRKKMGAFIRALGKQDEWITKFYERLWRALVDHVEVYSRKDIRFIFRDGTCIKVSGCKERTA